MFSLFLNQERPFFFCFGSSSSELSMDILDCFSCFFRVAADNFDVAVAAAAAALIPEPVGLAAGVALAWQVVAAATIVAAAVAAALA